MNRLMITLVTGLATALASLAVRADLADVIEVRAACAATCRFDVTVRHADSGWDHYADRWEVLAPDGRVLGTRILYHPHVDEQPFTRSLEGIDIPATLDEVTVRAHDAQHGHGGLVKRVKLPPRP